jgi:tRNA dimethylallyltransferase
VKPSELAPLLAVVGPTGSGKSELSLELAKQLDGEIVNCDSIQMYRYFNIGAAKLPEAERQGIPHHLIDILEPQEVFTAGDYARRARNALNEIRSRNRVPVIVGGTGFYLRALLEGLAPGPARDDALRARLQAMEKRRPGRVHRLLSRLDSRVAARVHPNDVQKAIRAVEICILARRPASEVFEQGRDRLSGFRVLELGLDPPREALYERLNRRAEKMFETGLIEEVQSLLARGVSPESKPFQSLGYRQALLLVQGKMKLAEAVESTRIETRHYAKRQWTWFRRDPNVLWLKGFGSDANIKAAALDAARKFLQ